MSNREADKKRRLAYTQGLLPTTYASECEKPDGSVLVAHDVELSALERIEQGKPSSKQLVHAMSRMTRFVRSSTASISGTLSFPVFYS